MPNLEYFNYAVLPTHLQDLAHEFYARASQLDPSCPAGAAAMRELLEERDAAIRAANA